MDCPYNNCVKVISSVLLHAGNTIYKHLRRLKSNPSIGFAWCIQNVLTFFPIFSYIFINCLPIFPIISWNFFLYSYFISPTCLGSLIVFKRKILVLKPSVQTACLGKIWFLNYGPKSSLPIRLRDFSNLYISRTSKLLITHY